MCRIVTSRSDADFTEVEAEATQLIDVLDGWNALEPVIAAAKVTMEGAKKVADKDGKRFVETKVCLDLGQLIAEAEGYRPVDIDEVEKKATQLKAQQAAVVRAQAVWEASTKLLSVIGPLAPAVTAEIAQLPGSEALQTNVAPHPPRTLEESTGLRANLDISLNRLQSFDEFLKPLLATTAPREGVAPVGSDQAVRATQQEAQEVVNQAAEEAKKLDREAASPAVEARADERTRFRPRMPTAQDVLLSLAAGLAAAVAYAATIYSDTWGSFPEWASAVAAGFVTPSLAQWVALPILRSVRWQRQPATDAPTVAEEVATQAGLKPKGV
jgi:hypothetical protein